MRTLVVGLNFASSPVEIREKLAFDDQSARIALGQLRLRFPCSECVVLSTCNRVELYFARLLHGHPRVNDMIQFLSEFHGLAPHHFIQSIYHHEDTEAIRHLFRVVSSLDSMIVGESEILRQAKTALALAEDEHTAGKSLIAMFQHAFAVAKEVHTRTGIGEGKTSVGSMAVDFAKQIFSRFDDKTVLMVGAGEIAEATLQHLLDLSPKAVWVTNRTFERAETVAGRYRAEPKPFDRLGDHLAGADIVITSTGSPKPIITRELFSHVMAERSNRPLQIIDIAVPRDVELEVGELDSVFLYNIDELQDMAERTLAKRRDRLDQCHEIIERNVREFMEWRLGRDVGTAIHELQNHVENMVRKEIEWVGPKLSNASEHDRQLLAKLAHRIARKILHHPVTNLTEHSKNGSAQVYVDTLRDLFGLNDEEE